MGYNIFESNFERDFIMTRKALIKKLEAELREKRKNFQEGKTIPLAEFDWGLPNIIAESRAEYRVENEA